MMGVLGGAVAVAEIGSFVHVDPEAVEVNGVSQLLELVGPVLLGVGVVPIWEDCWAWPDFSFEVVFGVGWIFKENVFFLSVVVGMVVFDFDSSI